jgi:hypothetical protein
MSVQLKAITDSGKTVDVAATHEGHIEVALHAPRLPFGSVHTESLYPVFQDDGVYGVNPVSMVATTSGTGSATGSDSCLVVSTGTTIYSQGAIQSRKRLRYRPGQGVIGRFTASFTSPVASSYQVAGFGHAEDGVYFGYKNTEFGILYSRRGVREVQTLTISTKSSTAENAVVTLNGTAFNVAVTNGASTVTTAYEISQGTYTGWKAEAIGSTVVFVADAVGNKTSTFSITGTTVVGSFAETKTGVAATETFIAQSTWNGDTCDGNGPSGFTIDPTKLNVFEIGIQYLGAGSVTFAIEIAPGDNNPDFVIVHTMRLPNTLTTTSFGNPSFPFTMAVYSAGSTTNLTLKVGSYAGFIEGDKYLQGPRFSYYGQSNSVSSASYLPLFTVRNTRYFNSRSNQATVNLISIAGAIKHTSPVTIYVFKNATLSGTPNFSQYSTSSATYVDTSATACTISDNNQLVWSGTLGDTGNFAFPFSDSITIQPGETITVAAKAVTGSPSWVTASLNTREDQ